MSDDGSAVRTQQRNARLAAASSQAMVPGWLHWSIPDPARKGQAEAFDLVVHELTSRIDRVTATVRPLPTPRPLENSDEN